MLSTRTSQGASHQATCWRSLIAKPAAAGPKEGNLATMSIPMRLMWVAAAGLHLHRPTRPTGHTATKTVLVHTVPCGQTISRVRCECHILAHGKAAVMQLAVAPRGRAGWGGRAAAGVPPKARRRR